MRNLLVAREPVFTVKQFDRLSNICDNAGQVVFGIVVIAPLFNQEQNSFVILLGILSAIFSWTASILLAKRGESV